MSIRDLILETVLSPISESGHAMFKKGGKSGGMSKPEAEKACKSGAAVYAKNVGKVVEGKAEKLLSLGGTDHMSIKMKNGKSEIVPIANVYLEGDF